jgi:hypothetical protein
MLKKNLHEITAARHENGEKYKRTEVTVLKQLGHLKSSIMWDTAPRSPLNVNRLHGVISQKTEVFITIVMRTKNPTISIFRWIYSQSCVINVSVHHTMEHKGCGVEYGIQELLILVLGEVNSQHQASAIFTPCINEIGGWLINGAILNRMTHRKILTIVSEMEPGYGIEWLHIQDSDSDS